eukprot:459712_1
MADKRRIKELEEELKSIKLQLQCALDKEEHAKHEHSDEFWNEILKNIKELDYIKSLIKNETINMYDVNGDNRTLLILAADRGSYEICQLCLNLGANIHHKDIHGHTASDRARVQSYYAIQQLLLFAKLNANIGVRIRQTAHDIHKQNGMTENIMKQLNLKHNTKQIFQSTIMDIMINILENKLAFSQDILNLCWELACYHNNNPLSSKLWKALKKTCKEVINNTQKMTSERDWFWFKSFILPSTIWFKEVERKDENDSKQDKSYLYYELLKLVEDEAQNALNQLEHDLSMLAKQDKNSWSELVQWDIPNQYRVAR